jgi:hypothetical protein
MSTAALLPAPLPVLLALLLRLGVAVAAFFGAAELLAAGLLVDFAVLVLAEDAMVDSEKGEKKVGKEIKPVNGQASLRTAPRRV